MGRNRCGKRRNCSLRAISLFPTVFSKGLFPRGIRFTDSSSCIYLTQVQQIGPSTSESTYTLGEKDATVEKEISDEMYGSQVVNGVTSPTDAVDSDIKSDPDKTKVTSTESDSKHSSPKRSVSRERTPIESSDSPGPLKGDNSSDIHKHSSNPFDEKEECKTSEGVLEQKKEIEDKPDR